MIKMVISNIGNFCVPGNGDVGIGSESWHSAQGQALGDLGHAVKARSI